MKRRDLNREYCNNNRTFNHYVSDHPAATNLITADIFRDIWMQNDHATAGVQIVELRSSESGKSGDSPDDDKDYFPLPHQFPVYGQWSCSKQNIEDDYRRNEAARERRRLNLNTARSNEFPSDASDCEDDYVFAEVFVADARNPPPENVMYNQRNCFTIHDKHYLNSDTSEEEYTDVEVIKLNRNETDPNLVYRNNYDDNMRYDQGDQDDKRTVWIYSFKNRNLLSESDFELVNIPSQDLSTNSSGDDFQQPTVENNVNRVSSPIPMYIPRLILPTTPTLPTLTEVTEPGKQSSTNEDTPIKRGFRENNWCASEPSTSKPRAIHPATSNSIVNWMALSPREKRRKMRYASPINLPSDLPGRLATVDEEIIPQEKKEASKADILVDLLTKGADETCQCGADCANRVVIENHDESYDVIVSCDRHSLAEGVSSKPDAQIESPLISSDKSVRTITIQKIGDASDELNNTEPLNREHSNISHYSSRDISVQAQMGTPKDRGDHLPTMKTVPRIRINSKLYSRTVDGPMENIESNNWIHEEPLIKDERIETPQDARGDRASGALWERNMLLLKPSVWAAYEEVFDQQSIPSLHLSMNTDSIEENQTFIKRVTKYLSCCKLFCK
ncbi:hypothetical protein O0L34_g15398 [Tuta absoluta]|nr:hypothetical protein O0L34_g15398 [Tuta absoluta]